MKRGLLGIALLAALSSHPEYRPPPPPVPDWWKRFIEEMEAIGCVNIRQDAHGEWAFDCPEHAIEAAKKIVAKYRARE